jgi:hypothetical protein
MQVIYISIEFKILLYRIILIKIYNNSKFYNILAIIYKFRNFNYNNQI